MQSSSRSPSAEPIVLVLIGPGGTGKGTVAQRLVDLDDALWLSRSWTTRPPRDGEDPNAYVFVDRPVFEGHIDADGFLEWAEFLGHLYGTPVPEPPDGVDVLLEIDLQGAHQVLERRPDATVVLLVPPSEDAQRARLRGRGDDEEHVERRVAHGRRETEEGRAIAHHVVVNDELEQAVDEVIGILDALRRDQRARAVPTEER